MNLSQDLPSPADLIPPIVLPMPYYDDYVRIIYILCYIWPAVILFGFVSNIVNIVVFMKAGAKDNVTILLIALSLSDLLYLIMVSPTICGFMMDYLVKQHHWSFDKNLLYFILYWPAQTCYDLSTYIAVSLGAIRCACVAMPLKFKAVFTKSRTIKWIMFLIVLAIVLRIPILTVNRIGWRIDENKNASVPYLNPVNREEMSKIVSILNRGIIIYIAFITMVACVVLLSYKLHQASKIRQFYANEESKSNIEGTAKSNQGLSSKDLHVVQSVTVVCIIFVLAQLPFVMTGLARALNPAIERSRGTSYLFGIFTTVSNTCSYLNASVNIFVYYHYNRTYRSLVRSWLPVKKEVEISRSRD